MEHDKPTTLNLQLEAGSLPFVEAAVRCSPSGQVNRMENDKPTTLNLQPEAFSSPFVEGAVRRSKSLHLGLAC